jgi:peroxiredoxin
MNRKRLNRKSLALLCAGAGLLGIGLLGMGLPVLAAPRHLPSAAKPALTPPVPGFHLPDLQGKTRSLSEFGGHPAALFFFCGCDSCHRCAKLWADVQRSGTLPNTPTVVVFSGEAEAARSFLAETGLDPAQTTLLTDPKDDVAAVYHAPVCPRIFVLDKRTHLRYTNNERGTDPQTMPAAVLVSRAISAFRAADTPAPKLHAPKILLPVRPK